VVKTWTPDIEVICIQPHGVRQFQADGRCALAGLDVQAVFDQPAVVRTCRDRRW
jgi:hypothetical protein